MVFLGETCASRFSGLVCSEFTLRTIKPRTTPLPVPHKNVRSNSTLPPRETVSQNKWYASRRPGSPHKSRLAAGDHRVSQPVHLTSRLRIYPAFRIRALEKSLHPCP